MAELKTKPNTASVDAFLDSIKDDQVRYIKRLSDVHLPTLKKLVKASVRQMIKTNALSAE